MLGPFPPEPALPPRRAPPARTGAACSAWTCASSARHSTLHKPLLCSPPVLRRLALRGPAKRALPAPPPPRDRREAPRCCGWPAPLRSDDGDIEIVLAKMCKAETWPSALVGHGQVGQPSDGRQKAATSPIETPCECALSALSWDAAAEAESEGRRDGGTQGRRDGRTAGRREGEGVSPRVQTRGQRRKRERERDREERDSPTESSVESGACCERRRRVARVLRARRARVVSLCCCAWQLDPFTKGEVQKKLMLERFQEEVQRPPMLHCTPSA